MSAQKNADLAIARVAAALDCDGTSYVERDLTIARVRAALGGVTETCTASDEDAVCEYPAGHGPVRVDDYGDGMEEYDHGVPSRGRAWAFTPRAVSDAG